jgi:hypothetical protein
MPTSWLAGRPKNGKHQGKVPPSGGLPNRPRPAKGEQVARVGECDVKRGVEGEAEQPEAKRHGHAAAGVPVAAARYSRISTMPTTVRATTATAREMANM